MKNINKIGFRNFRRFEYFPLLEYGGITFLVGRNNAGKSTLVKALLLINDFLKSNSIERLSFGNNVLADANIVTYGRARNRVAKENIIEFYYQVKNYAIVISVSGDDDKTFAHVHHFGIQNIDNGLVFSFEPVSSGISISRQQPDIDLEEQEQAIKLLNESIELAENEIKTRKLKKTSKDYISLISEIDALKKKKDVLLKDIKAKDSKTSYSIDTFYGEHMTSEDAIEFAIDETLYLHDIEFQKSQSKKKPSKKFADYRGFKEDAKLIRDSFKDFFNTIRNEKIVYLGANPAKQSALFAIRDVNNALAQSVHEFHQLKITSGEPAYQFVKKWMKEFEVGDDFKISQIAGEAYEVTISSHGVEIPLADKGMGSIQAMLLILRLATIIHKTRTFSGIQPTVVIEEPELNLHPALQSKLADLFLDCYEQFGLKFIIETHSEYILRRSQVLVVEKEFEVHPNENPHFAYYFPKELSDYPYMLKYNTDGTFDKNFGTGFFDEASASTLTLLKLKRQNKA